jgi:hypothetical protein
MERYEISCSPALGGGSLTRKCDAKMQKSAKAATFNVQEQGQDRQLAFWDRFRITVNRATAMAGLPPFDEVCRTLIFLKNDLFPA